VSGRSILTRSKGSWGATHDANTTARKMAAVTAVEATVTGERVKLYQRSLSRVRRFSP